MTTTSARSRSYRCETPMVVPEIKSLRCIRRKTERFTDISSHKRPFLLVMRLTAVSKFGSRTYPGDRTIHALGPKQHLFS